MSARHLVPLLALLAACQATVPFDPENLAVGPGGMVGNGDPLTDGATYAGGRDVLPTAPRAGVTAPTDASALPDCDAGCRAYCDGLALENPVNRGLCGSLWGVGLRHRPVVPAEACRRLFVDVVGRLPSADEAARACQGDWDATVKALLADPAFVALEQRRFADRFLYSTEVVSLQAIYDMDRLVKKLLEGRVPYDLFATVASVHPVLTRRVADAGDRAEAAFRQFLGRPPFENERADMARLYRLWHSGYYDHPALNLRLPDAYLRYRCNQEDGSVDEARRGECASVLWGYHEVLLSADLRASYDPRAEALTVWSGLLTADEWYQLQTPGRILAAQRAFWEKAVDDVLVQYLGYALSPQVPEVREELVRWLLEHDGDLRSVHHAVLTSAAYLQSHAAPDTAGMPYRWTFGPLKQVEAEVWLDGLARAAGYREGACDHRISRPQQLLEASSLAAYRVLTASRWKLTEQGELDLRYANLARTLGGCPDNVAGGRFKVVSILTTATQLAFARAVCDPAVKRDAEAAPLERLVPAGVGASQALTPELAARIAAHQYRALLGRDPTDAERREVQAAAEYVARETGSAERFARPLCYALLSNAEQLFY